MRIVGRGAPSRFLHFEHRAFGRAELTIRILAFAGLSGAGKSTAIAQLVAAGAGTNYYVGDLLTREIKARGLVHSPDTERELRARLREEQGMAVFAEHAVAEIATMEEGLFFLDAVCCPEERDCYRASFGSALSVIAMEASFETRAGRLAIRPKRPLDADQLAARDALEMDSFRIGKVMAEADHRFVNEGTLEELEQALRRLHARIGG